MSTRKLSDTFGKFKGASTSLSSPSSSSSPPSAMPSFRFNKADEELVEIPIATDDVVCRELEGKSKCMEERGSQKSDASSYAPTSSPVIDIPLSKDSPLPSNSATPSDNDGEQVDISSLILREPTPIKDAILTKFARLAPHHISSQTLPTSAADGAKELGSSLPVNSATSSSWLTQVKGKIAKTVEEKYSEYKHERVKRLANQMKTAEGNFDFSYEDCTPSEVVDDFGGEKVLSHSFSETRLTDSFCAMQSDMKGSQSQSFTDTIANLDDNDFLSSLPSNNLPSEDTEDDDSKTTVAPCDSPKTPKERRRFTFSFLDKSVRSSEKAIHETKETELDLSISHTPSRSSLRSRMMGLMGKGSPSAQNALFSKDRVSFSKDLSSSPSFEDPFSGVSDLFPDRVNSDNQSDFVEEALEADEKLVFDPSQEPSQEVDEICDSEEHDPEQREQGWLIHQYWWMASLPICVILFLQLMPLPSWLIGFLTGLILGVPTAIYLMWRFFIRDTLEKPTRFIDNVDKKAPKRPAIIVQEELERKYTWMNMWSAKNGPYDPLTYDVRRTMSVRVMLHGPWIELKFPKRNLPLRRMYEDIEPTNIAFYDYKEVVDLTNCSIELTPENLPSKRVWSKKYPIKITTRVRKPCSEGQDSSKKVVLPVLELVPDPAEVEVPRNSEETTSEEFRSIYSAEFHPEEDVDEDDEIMHDASGEFPENPPVKDSAKEEESEDGFEILQESSRSFYLFARTSREKEEWFNKFMVGAKFMQDWNHQNPPKERTIRPDPLYETFKVREQRFKIFMENYFQARHSEAAEKVHDEFLKNEEKRQVAREQMAFLNIFGARLWHDLHSSKIFIDLLREKLTRKLLKVKIAQYFEEVSVTTLNLGTQLPQILSASLPWQDENGLWVNLEIEYNGICQATVETQGIRLPAKDEPDREAQEWAGRRQPATIDSDEEDSAEEDDEIPESNDNSSLAGGVGSEGQVHGAGFRARVLEGLLRSEFVAKVAESEWVKKNITGRNITLQLQLHLVKGTLTINFPPAPSDRMWYCFRTPPQLELALRPCFGGKSLGKYESTFSSVMRLLEKRLKQEFIKVLVYPNMEDEPFPFLEHIPYSLNS